MNNVGGDIFLNIIFCDISPFRRDEDVDHSFDKQIFFRCFPECSKYLHQKQKMIFKSPRFLIA